MFINKILVDRLAVPSRIIDEDSVISNKTRRDSRHAER